MFPQGLTAYFYDDSLNIEAYIKAKHVIYREKERLWEAKNHVEGQNLKNKKKYIKPFTQYIDGIITNTKSIKEIYEAFGWFPQPDFP